MEGVDGNHSRFDGDRTLGSAPDLVSDRDNEKYCSSCLHSTCCDTSLPLHRAVHHSPRQHARLGHEKPGSERCDRSDRPLALCSVSVSPHVHQAHGSPQRSRNRHGSRFLCHESEPDTLVFPLLLRLCHRAPVDHYGAPVQYRSVRTADTCGEPAAVLGAPCIPCYVPTLLFWYLPTAQAPSYRSHGSSSSTNTAEKPPLGDGELLVLRLPLGAPRTPAHTVVETLSDQG